MCIFYFLSHLNKIYLFIARYIESGCYKGFMEQVGQELILKELNIISQIVFLWNVYTGADLSLRHNQIKVKYSKRVQLGKLSHKALNKTGNIHK